MGTEISFEKIRTALIAVSDELSKNRQYYNDLDSPIGDSDHGDSVCSAFKKVGEVAYQYSDNRNDIGDLLNTVGRAIIFSSGAAMGPLYGTAFTEAGKAVAGKSELTFEDFVKMWVAFVGGIEKRGGVKVGEKTMFDTIQPGISTLEFEFSNGKTLKEACSVAIEAAERGMNSTKNMLSLRGRSSRLGERSLGHIDPGSASMFTMISTFFKTVV
jgi:dihydroxyacetone kinase-like protein